MFCIYIYIILYINENFFTLQCSLNSNIQMRLYLMLFNPAPHPTEHIVCVVCVADDLQVD